MKIAAASDVHGKWRQVDWPKADVLCIAGDILPNLSWDWGRDAILQLDSLKKLDDYCAELKKSGVYKHIVLVAGNHDFVFERQRNKAEELCKNIIYLQDESVEICGKEFYGSPWQTWFGGWAFNFPDHNENFFRARAHARMCWDRIPTTTDVLITHSPPFGIRDQTLGGKSVGCKWLSERLQKLVLLKLHIFGHIHPGYGVKTISRTRYANASVCNEHYQPVNKIQVFEV